jgi:hypothetical protein
VNISRDLFDGFVQAHSIMPPFWKFMFTFGRKKEENEFQFPHFARRGTAGIRGLLNPFLELRNTYLLNIELAYMLRRVELHDARPGYDNPWSIRQTAVYHKLSVPKNDAKGQRMTEAKSMFLLVAPSKNAGSVLSECLSNSTTKESDAMSPWSIHRILVADSLRGWMDYMAYLEKRLKEQVSSSAPFHD